MDTDWPLYIPNPKVVELIFTPQEHPSITLLEIPFGHIDNNPYFKDACNCVGEGSFSIMDPCDFPNNITEYYWIQKENDNGKEYWDCLCKLNTDYYAHYWAVKENDDEEYVMGMYISKTREGLFPYIEYLLRSIVRKKKSSA